MKNINLSRILIPLGLAGLIYLYFLVSGYGSLEMLIPWGALIGILSGILLFAGLVVLILENIRKK